MDHAPVSADVAATEQPPVEIHDQALAGDVGSGGLREAYLTNAQAQMGALFAPFFLATGLGCALVVAWGMFGSVDLLLIAGWLGLLAGAHWFTYRKALDAGAVSGSRTAKLIPEWRYVAAAVGFAALWASLPTYAFATQPARVQVVVGGAMGAMNLAAIALAAIPAAATAWIAVMTLALATGYFFGVHTLDMRIGLTFVGVAAIAVFGVTRLTRWVFSQLQETASSRAQSESIRLLLREYEHRGVGWLWQVDAENRVTYISSRMTQLLGRSANQMIGHSLASSLGGSSELGRTLLDREAFANLEMEIRTKRGTRWISLSGDPIVDIGGKFQGFRGVGTDITDVRRTQERLTHLANMDVLSGLPNRGRVRQLLGEALSNALATNVPCAILFLDLDGFKPVNDTFGHPRGDAVLKGVAQRLVKEVGDAGYVGRIGGDEFAIVIKDAQSRRGIETLAERLIQSVAEPHQIDKHEIKVGVSIGCAFGPIDGNSVDDLIQRADMALYQAKNQGRGACCYFNETIRSAAENRLKMEKDLAEAIGLGQLRLVYQPQINAADQSLLGFEGLIRWHHPTRGVVPPVEFIPLAEETGLIVPLGEWVIQEACRTLATWPEQITLAINVSAKQLILPSLPAVVNGYLHKSRVQANRLELEVTESVFLEDSPGALDVLKRLRALGISIALDDFGTGYSSLGYLNKAVFHKLKIDGSFVREAATNKETVAIIQSIVSLAKSFRMTVTAEGVETAEDFTRMRELGCHQIQGYLFGRPMPYERASELVHGSPTRLTA